MNYTGKESSIRVEKVIRLINKSTVNVTGKEKMEVITNICKKYEINREHILNVGYFYYLKDENEIIRNNGTNS